MKTHYDILGIAPGAGADEIRRAYLLRSKVLHPDRFDRAAQASEWSLANELAKELNAAYAVLRDQAQRAEYDQTLAAARAHAAAPGVATAPAPAPPPPGPPGSSPADLGRLVAGYTRLGVLPRSVRDRLLQRQADALRPQFRAATRDLLGNHFAAGAGLLWFALLFALAGLGPWPGFVTWLLLLLSALACALLGTQADWLLRWHRSPLKCHFFVTPLYLVRTHLDEIWFWPLWELKKVSAFRRPDQALRPGGTDVTVTLAGESQVFTLRTSGLYQRLIETIKTFDLRLLRAREQDDWGYFYREDDFRLAPETAPAPPPWLTGTQAWVYSAAFIAGTALFALAYLVNQRGG